MNIEIRDKSTNFKTQRYISFWFFIKHSNRINKIINTPKNTFILLFLVKNSYLLKETICKCLHILLSCLVVTKHFLTVTLCTLVSHSRLFNITKD